MRIWSSTRHTPGMLRAAVSKACFSSSDAYEFHKWTTRPLTVTLAGETSAQRCVFSSPSSLSRMARSSIGRRPCPAEPRRPHRVERRSPPRRRDSPRPPRHAPNPFLPVGQRCIRHTKRAPGHPRPPDRRVEKTSTGRSLVSPNQSHPPSHEALFDLNRGGLSKLVAC